MNAIDTAEQAARYVLRACPELLFERPLLGGHPAWHFQGFDGPEAFYRACEYHLRSDRFSPVERWVTAPDTRKAVREAAEHLASL